MAFDWWEPRVGQVVRARAAERAQESLRQEIRDRAAILMRLGWDAEHARARCRRNLAWELELQDEPAAAGEVDALVRRVYDRR